MPNSDTVSLRPGDMIITFGQCMCLVLFRFLRIQKDWQNFFCAKVYTVIEAGTRGPPHWFYYPGFYDHAS